MLKMFSIVSCIKMCELKVSRDTDTKNLTKGINEQDPSISSGVRVFFAFISCLLSWNQILRGVCLSLDRSK